MFARVPDTGEARWFYQTSPHDLFDHDGVNELVLADLTMDGSTRKVAMRADRNGLLYVIDRTSGEVLSATPFGYVNSNRGVDMKTGRLIPVEEKDAEAGRRRPRHLPRGAGHEGLAADVVLAAHRPALHPAPEPVRGHRRHGDAATSPARRYVGASVVYKAGPGGQSRRRSPRGIRSAAKAAWEIKEKLPGVERHASSPPATSSSTGRWTAGSRRSTRGPASCCGSSSAAPGSSASRSSTEGPDGHEYVAVLVRRRRLGRRDRQQRSRSARCDGRQRLRGASLADLKSATTRGGMLYVFSLGGGAHEAPRGRAVAALARRAARRPAAGRAADAAALRVCADPNNLPFSNAPARDSRTGSPSCSPPIAARALEYTWWAQRRGFVRNTLDGRRAATWSWACRRDFEPRRDDAALLPVELRVRVAARRGARTCSSLDDPRLRRLRIGVQMIGDDFSNSPPAHALSAPRHRHATSSATPVYRRLLAAEPARRRSSRRSSAATSTSPSSGGRPPATSRAQRPMPLDADAGRAAAPTPVAAVRVRHLDGRAARRRRAARRARRLHRHGAAATSTRSWTTTACRASDED